MILYLNLWQKEFKSKLQSRIPDSAFFYGMINFTITGVPEHFNYPWHKLIAKQHFLNEGLELIWRDESRGSGKMIEQLDQNETDIAIILTESFFKRYEADDDLKIIGLYVQSPLTWGIHIAPSSDLNSLKDVKKPQFLISRKGSGSDLMSKVLMDRENWKIENATYEIVNNLPGALQAMDTHKNGLFLWEKFTTKPFVDSGEMNRIGEVPSPWPCFVIAAKQTTIDSNPSFFSRLLDKIYVETKEVENSESSTAEIADFYSLNLEDVKLWKSQTKWQTDHTIVSEELDRAIENMVKFKILKSDIDWRKAFETELNNIQ